MQVDIHTYIHLHTYIHIRRIHTLYSSQTTFKSGSSEIMNCNLGVSLWCSTSSTVTHIYTGVHKYTVAHPYDFKFVFMFEIESQADFLSRTWIRIWPSLFGFIFVLKKRIRVQTFDPEKRIFVAQASYRCDLGCFVYDNSDQIVKRADNSKTGQRGLGFRFYYEQ